MATFSSWGADGVRVARDPRINDLSEAIAVLAGAVSGLAEVVANDPDRAPQVIEARRAAGEAERMAERLLVNP
jgi:hypothetical protein